MIFNKFIIISFVLALASTANGDYDDQSGGILRTLFSPFRATIEHARRFFGHRINNVNDGINMLGSETFTTFMRLYNKTYSPEEIPKRFALFVRRTSMIEESRKLFTEGRLPFVMRENAFLDWDEDELKALAGVSPPRSLNELTPEEKEAVESETDAEPIVARSLDGANNTDSDDFEPLVRAESIPASIDWRTTGCVAAPINQQRCGACYAIATMGALESMRCIRRVSSSTLSPQQIVDCATPRAGYQNYGCNGGWPTRVLKYLQDVGIAARESCYPFIRRQTACRLRQVQASHGCTVRASPTDGRLNYRVLNNERDMLYHVAKTGPVVTVMKATDKFLYYGSGIFDDPSCSRRRDDVDHAIVVVGYGRENGVDYWLIKNSWGTTTWGEGGYAKYKRGTYACSIGHWGWVIE